MKTQENGRLLEIGSSAGFGGVVFVRDCWRCDGSTAHGSRCPHCDAINPWGEASAETQHLTQSAFTALIENMPNVSGQTDAESGTSKTQ